MRCQMKARFAFLILLAVATLTAGCGSIQLDMGLAQPTELTATAQAMAGTKAQPGKLAYVHGGDIWVRCRTARSNG